MTDIIDNTGKKSEWTPGPQLIDGLIDYTETPDGRQAAGGEPIVHPGFPPM